MRVLCFLFVSLLTLRGLALELWNPALSAYWLPLELGRGGLTFYAANHLNYLEGAWGAMAFDLEEWGAVAGFTLEEGPWGIGVYLPVALYWGGVMDPFLDALHARLGLPYNRVQGETLLLLRTPQGERRWEGPTLGFKDPYLRVEYREGPLTAFAALGLPLAPVDRFLGSGGFRALVGGGWRWEGGGARVGLLLPLGQAELFQGLDLRPSLGGSARLKGVLGTPLDLEVQLITSPIGAGPQIYGALRVYWGGWGFAEGIPFTVPDGMPDVVFSWAPPAPEENP